MPLVLPFRCWRGLTDCEPLASIEATPEDLDEESYASGEFTPESFVCTGCVAEESRTIPQDAYRVCWKTHLVDEKGDYDEQDMTHLLTVVSQALAVIATRRVNSGTIDVPTRQRGAENAS